MSKKFIFPIILILVFIVAGYFIVRPKEKVNEQNLSATQNINETESNQISQPKFQGEKGETVNLVDGRISIIADVFNDNLVHYYNTELPSGKVIYFFIVKDRTGIYRAAANACQVCFDARMGFHQEGDFMVCNACGNKYPLAKIATEKGGCNPGPINPNLEIQGVNIVIEQQDLKQVSELF